MAILVIILVTGLDIPIQICLRVILMYLIELLTCENLYFATNIIVLSAPEHKLWPYIVSAAILAAILD